MWPSYQALRSELIYCKWAFCQVVLCDVCLQSLLKHSLHLWDLSPPLSSPCHDIAPREQECRGALLSLDGGDLTRIRA